MTALPLIRCALTGTIILIGMTVNALPLPTPVKLAPADGRTGILFGTAVGVSGTTAAAGAAFDANGMFASAGAVFVYTRSGGIWTQQQRLLANDGAANDNLGAWVEVVGDTLYASAPENGPLSGPKPGAVYVFQRSGGIWTQVEKLVPTVTVASSNFGQRMAINDRFLLLSGSDASDQRVVYQYERVAGFWQQTGTLQPSGGGSFAAHLSLWQRTVVVGANGASNVSGVGTGAAYVFDHNGSAFAQTTKLTPGDGLAADQFGFSASIWGKRIVVGAYMADVGAQPDSGAAYVYELGPSGWTQTSKLIAPDGLANDQFGKDVRICGDRILVGAPMRNEGSNPDQGAIYLFDRVGGIWTFGEKVTLAPPGRSNAYFGDHLAVDAKNLVVGAPFISEAYAFAGGCAVEIIHADGFEP